MTIDALIIYLLIAAVGLLTAEVFRLNERLRKILLGKSGQDLETTVTTLSRGLENLDRRLTEVESFSVALDGRVKGSIQRVHTVRFNPFKDQGSNQSFATSFMDESGNGVVISSLYSRDKVSVYAKPLNAYRSEYDLSNEEKEAIAGGRALKK